MVFRKSAAFLLAFTTVLMLVSAIFPAMPAVEVKAAAYDPNYNYNIEEKLAAMTIREKVAQLFIVTPEALAGVTNTNTRTTVTPEFRNRLQEFPVGGIILFGDQKVDNTTIETNVRTPSQLKKLTKDLQEAAVTYCNGIPFFISIDEEGGVIARIAKKTTFASEPLVQGHIITSIYDDVGQGKSPQGTTTNAQNLGSGIGAYLKEYGINTDFAPIADIWSNSGNKVIGKRAFGTTAAYVADMVEAEIQGFQSKKIFTCAKHFPGHGDTDGDSHNGFVGVTKTWEEMLNCEIIPFQRAIDAGVDMIMVAHITPTKINPEGDNTPASLSRIIVTDKLRTALGYDGVVITDGMNMGAITTKYGAGPAAVKVIDAGGDMILGPADFDEAYNAVLNAVENGTIPIERLNASVRRILKLKVKYQPAEITWKNEDGTVIDTTTVEAGTVPTHANPTKPATAQYTYTFDGWSPTPYEALGNETYTATYTQTVREYTVTWKNYNGDVLETDSNVPYGTMPSYDGGNPTKPADEQYTYEFARWSPSKAPVTGDVTYTAEFTHDKSTYKVVWYNYNGDVLETDSNVPYGTMPEYNGATPTKPADEQYTYTFDGWTPSIAAVTGDAEYTAKFKKLPRKYTVIWKNNDGTVLETDNDVPYGDVPEYNGANPSKAPSGGKRFVFCGWDKGIAPVNSDTTYTAQFAETNEGTFAVLWMNDNGELIKSALNLPSGSDAPSYDGQTPTKAPDAQYTYTFSGWSAPKSVIYPQQRQFRAAKAGGLRPLAAGISSDEIFTALYSTTTRTYTVTWVNDDGERLETDDNVPYGTTPEYNRASPTKEETEYYTYAFTGWTPGISPVTGHSTYTATYTATKKTYTVTWKNYDGTELEKDESVPAGNMPEYNGNLPARESTETESYIFKGWAPAVAPVTADTVYKAQFETVLATDRGKIVIREAVAGVTYNAYRIFDFRSSGASSGVYTLREGDAPNDVAWRNFAESTEVKNVYIEIDGSGFISWHGDADVREFAKLAMKWAGEHNVACDAAAMAADNPPAATIETNKLGYYLVDTNVGSICSLDTTNLNVAIYEKNPVPTLKKQVEEEAGSGDWRAANDAEIGEEVHFQSIITVPERPVHSGENVPATAGAAGYVYHDQMASGLTFDSDTLEVWHKTGTFDYTEVASSDKWTLETTGLTAGETFRITFVQTWLDTLKPEDKIKITYSAKVAEDAVIGGGGNENKGNLDYGDGAKFETGWQQTVTKVWSFSIFKKNSADEALPNAQFRILRANSDGTLVPGSTALVFETKAGETDRTYRMSDDQSSAAADSRVIDLVTPVSGKIYLEGLDSGRYLIHEEEAPAGYSKMYGDVLIEIGSDGSVYYIDDGSWSNPADKQIPVLNQSGVLLPSTGSRGTRALVAIGYLLVITAFTALVTKKMFAYME